MFELIPAVDVLDGRVVRLMHGDYDRVTVYGEDPVGVARRWMEEGASLVHVVDLAGARSGAGNPSLWRAMTEGGVRFEVGGGIRTTETARAAIEAGAEYVVMGTAAVYHPEILGELATGGRVMAAVDVRDGLAQGSGWLDRGRPVRRVLEELVEVGIRRVLVTGIGRDGTMEGPETELMSVALGFPELDVIASGGVGRLEDLVRLAEMGCAGAIVGRALYEGQFGLSQALEVVGGDPR